MSLISIFLVCTLQPLVLRQKKTADKIKYEVMATLRIFRNYLSGLNLSKSHLHTFNANHPPGGGGGRGRGYSVLRSQIYWMGVCRPLPKTLTLFMTKICDFPHPIYDPVLLLKTILNSRPECKNDTLFMTKMAKIDTLFMTKKNKNPGGPYQPI